MTDYYLLEMRAELYRLKYGDSFHCWAPKALKNPKTPKNEKFMTVEEEIQEKGLTAPRITPQDIENVIKSEHYFTAYDGRSGAQAEGTYYGRETPPFTEYESLKTLTFAVLVLQNGFTVTGESNCASPTNFDASLGRKIARENAVNKIWALEGYLLKTRLQA